MRALFRSGLLAGVCILATVQTAGAQGYPQPPPPPPPGGGGGGAQPQQQAYSQWGGDVLVGFAARAWVVSGPSEDDSSLSGTGFSIAFLGGLNLSKGRRMGLYVSYISGTATDDFDNEIDASNTVIGFGASNASLLGNKLIFRAAIGLSGNTFSAGGFEASESGLGTMIGIDIKVHRNAALFLVMENSFFFPDEVDGFQHIAATVGVSFFTPYSGEPTGAPPPPTM